MGNAVRNIWYNYKSEVLFGAVMVALVVLSTYLSRFIPERIFDHVLTPAFNVCTIAVAFSGAWFIFRHSEGLRLRRFWGYTLLLWGFGDLSYLICYLVAPMEVMNMGATHITTFELLIGNLLGWFMTLYPTETLRPGWLTGKVVVWQLVPMMLLVGLDYLIPIDLWPLVALYPYGLFVLVLSHIHEYRKWCEENFSSMDNIDVQWIIRYCIMFFFLGANYVYMCSTHDHARGFTQQWFAVFMLAYCTEQILFRKDPRRLLKQTKDEIQGAEDEVLSSGDTYRAELEAWMETEKPYLNPSFQLIDLQKVLPINRTYLSQLINTTYGCSFYQFANRYRIEEAKRLMREHPELKMGEIAIRSGFSSAVTFSRIFSQETGTTPKEWSKK